MTAHDSASFTPPKASDEALLSIPLACFPKRRRSRVSISFFGKSPFWETSISQIRTDIMPAHLELDANELGWLLEQCRPYANLSEFHASLFHIS
jgi:hypothetical protein